MLLPARPGPRAVHTRLTTLNVVNHFFGRYVSLEGGNKGLNLQQAMGLLRHGTDFKGSFLGEG